MNLQDKTIEILLENKNYKKVESDFLHDEESLTDIENKVMDIMKQFNKFKLQHYQKNYLTYDYNYIGLQFDNLDSINNTTRCSLCLNPYVSNWINPSDKYPSYENNKMRKYFNKNKEFIDYCNNLFKDCYKNGLAWNGNFSSLWFWGEKDIKLNELENYLILLNKDVEEFLKVDLDKFWSKRK